MKTTQLTAQLMGSHEIEIHYRRPLFKNMRHISCADEANDRLREYINTKQLDLRECFWVILMSNANRVLSISEVATGTTLGVQPNPKYIFQLALLTNASAIIVAHNHPSGTLNISASDIKETRKLQKLSKLLDITLLDHLIITSESFVSLAQENKL